MKYSRLFWKRSLLIMLCMFLLALQIACNPIGAATPLTTPTALPSPTLTLRSPAATRTASETSAPPSITEIPVKADLYTFRPGLKAASYDAWNLEEGRFVNRFSYLSDRDASGHSPAGAFPFTFAHFANEVAYWTKSSPPQLWISDLDYSWPQLLFSDDEKLYPVFSDVFKINLTWSPDDLHLMVRVQGNPTLDMIYHLQNGILEKWPWHCDRVALSPRTQQLASWCSSTMGETRFAVMEWGGEIWYSDAGPKTEIVRGIKLSSDMWPIDWVQTWAWSADGQQVAYFDPADPNGHLYIANSSGVRLKILPEGVRDLPDISLNFPDILQWSKDGHRLLMSAFGSEKHPCTVQGQESSVIPCWQVLDTQTGEVLWTFADSIEAIASLMQLDATGRAMLEASGSASLSPDGNILMLNATSGALELSAAVDISKGGQIISSINYMGSTGLVRWGKQPVP